MITSIARPDILNYMKQTQSILEGHFELSSGVHTQTYFQCAKLLQYPDIAEKIGQVLASQIDVKIDTVLSPAIGGIVIGYVVARSLGARTIFVERKEGALSLRRGFEISEGERVFIVEDVITTAKSALESSAIAEGLEAEVLGYGCIVDRSQNKTGLNIKSLIQITPEIYQPQDCPLCKQGIELVKPGSKAKIKLDNIES